MVGAKRKGRPDEPESNSGAACRPACDVFQSAFRAALIRRAASRVQISGAKVS
jgi:hypothetical protein